jgi:hypothetical protein
VPEGRAQFTLKRIGTGAYLSRTPFRWRAIAGHKIAALVLLIEGMKTLEAAELLIKATEFRKRASDMRTRSRGLISEIARADLLAAASTYEDLARNAEEKAHQ